MLNDLTHPVSVGGKLEMMRVRATDPRPCPKCGKIYRSAHTLRTHMEDKHTICPGYRCVLCGTVAKELSKYHLLYLSFLFLCAHHCSPAGWELSVTSLYFDIYCSPQSRNSLHSHMSRQHRGISTKVTLTAPCNLLNASCPARTESRIPST